MNNQNINDDSKETKNNVGIVDANLLNPLQSNQYSNNSNTNVSQNSSENEKLVEKPKAVSNSNNNEIVNGVNQNVITNNNSINAENNLYSNYSANQGEINGNIQNYTRTTNLDNIVQSSFNNNSNILQSSNNVINSETRNDKIINPLNADTTVTNNDSKKEVKEDELVKIAKNLNIDFLVLGIFSIIAFVYLISQGSFKITYIIDLVILAIGYIGFKNKKPYAAVYGFITGVFMIISGSIIDILLGIFIIIRSFKYNKMLKKNEVKTKMLLCSIIGIIGVVAITFAITYFDLHNGHILKCTRSSGENIEITFDSNGIQP